MALDSLLVNQPVGPQQSQYGKLKVSSNYESVGDKEGKKEIEIVEEFSGHKFGIESVLISPDSRHIVSLGDSNDKGLLIWDLKISQKAAANRMKKTINSIAFQDSGEGKAPLYFVTVGIDMLKYWHFHKGSGDVKLLNPNDTIMENTSANLKNVTNKKFVAVVCKSPHVLVLNEISQLYFFDDNGAPVKYIDV